MQDFDIIIKNNYIDIDLLQVANNYRGFIINAILEESRIPLASKQPTLERGGSIKDNINNTTGLRYGSLLWYYLRIYNGENAIKYIKPEIINILNHLMKIKIINSWENLEVAWQNRLLTIKFSYYANNELHKINTSI